MHTSSTQTVPEAGDVPRHVAIIMDGNGRWAKQRLLPRVAGHKRGVGAVRDTVKTCGDLGIEYLTLFAFSSENWRRPAEEVSVLMQLFMAALENEVAKLHDNKVRFKVIGDLVPFGPRIRELVARAEEITRDNTKLTLTIAANYGGRWDILQAANNAQKEKLQQLRALLELQKKLSDLLGIHLANGALIYAIGRRIVGCLLDPSTVKAIRPEVLALLAAGLWLLHPLQSMAVNYLIQRCESLMAWFFALN